ncbi:hypothetical protein MUN77_01715 [Leucobacter allii]|uniref:hypothetical protein n=1 Tax=Leucobacter allii TaxID=2932247 RepID=UPI001FD03488|nr:hypothetical protein [Leucobacter allii]UOR02077.1 hypothetical protein MUN77_01715 [Leucobacter allii]
MSVKQIDAVQAELQKRDYAPVDLEKLYRELPDRGARTEAHIAVAIAISREYRRKLRPAHELLRCRDLVAEWALRVGSDGRYVALHGEPLELVSDRTDLIDELLERRLDCDFFELWEASGGSVERDGDTDAFTRFVVDEVGRRCLSTDKSYCDHNPKW